MLFSGWQKPIGYNAGQAFMTVAAVPGLGRSGTKRNPMEE